MKKDCETQDVGLDTERPHDIVSEVSNWYAFNNPGNHGVGRLHTFGCAGCSPLLAPPLLRRRA